jgi:hypothetical protein
MKFGENQGAQRGADANPRAGEIEQAWALIEAELKAMNGAKARDHLAALAAKNDIGVWNACHWRTRDWFIRRFAVMGCNSAAEPWEDFSLDAYVNWMWRIRDKQKQPDEFDSADLPYMLQELEVERDRAKAIREAL